MKFDKRVLDSLSNFLQHELEGGYVEGWIKKSRADSVLEDAASSIDKRNLELLFKRDIITTKENNKLHIKYEGGKTYNAKATGHVYLEIYSKDNKLMLSQYRGPVSNAGTVILPAGGLPIEFEGSGKEKD